MISLTEKERLFLIDAISIYAQNEMLEFEVSIYKSVKEKLQCASRDYSSEFDEQVYDLQKKGYSLQEAINRIRSVKGNDYQ